MRASDRIRLNFSRDRVTDQYEQLFLNLVSAVAGDVAEGDDGRQ